MTEKSHETPVTDTLRARAHWYRLLSGVFAEEPGVEFLQQLRSDACLAALAELGLNFGDDFLRPEHAELAETLACEYTMLFVAPGGFPPMESVRLLGGLRQRAANEVRAFYTQHGFVMHGGRFAAFDDHLAGQLQFVAALLEHEADALTGGEDQQARRMEKSVKRFWVQHLGRWVRGYAMLMEDAAEHSFYREMARLLADFAEAELQLLGLDVADLDGGRWRAPKPEEVSRPMQCGGGAS